MKKVYKIEGLDCANCAAKIENNIGKLEGVKSCSLSFMTGKLVIEMEQNLEKEIFKIIKKVEPDVEIK